MNDSRPQWPPGLRKRLPAPQQSIDERASYVSCSGVNGHARGLVDGDDVVIFVKDIQGNRFRRRVRRWPRVGPHGDEFSATKFLRRFCGLAIDEDQAAVDEFLHTRSREFPAVGGHETV